MKKIVLFVCLCWSMMFAAVDINSASKKELMALKGIGATKASRIIEYRKNQPFKSLDELKNIKGFGKKLIQKLSSELEVKTVKNPS